MNQLNLLLIGILNLIKKILLKFAMKYFSFIHKDIFKRFPKGILI